MYSWKCPMQTTKWLKTFDIEPENQLYTLDN